MEQKTYNPNAKGIKFWAEEDRPREKMLQKGVRSLTNAELMAILLGSGSRNKSAVDLAKEILQDCNNDLNELGRYTPGDLTRFNGIGNAKAVTIASAMELGRRRKLKNLNEKPQIKSSHDAYELLRPQLGDLANEEFWVIYMNRNNRVIKQCMVSSGGVSGTAVDSKLVFSPAVKSLCSSIILAHNHPSGNLNPSNSDIHLTKKLKQAGDLFDIRVLDHIIIAQTGYYSFLDSGLI